MKLNIATIFGALSLLVENTSAQCGVNNYDCCDDGRAIGYCTNAYGINTGCECGGCPDGYYQDGCYPCSCVPLPTCVPNERSCCGDGEIYYEWNGYTGCKTTARRGRRLNQLDNPKMYDCQKVMYQLSVETTGSSKAHLSFVAKPQFDALDDKSSECPFLSIDSVPDSANGNLDIAIHILNEEDVLADDDQNILMLGLFNLEAIQEAFTTASVQNSGTKYDFIENNCASFLISMGYSLGIDPSDKNIEKITSFIAQQISSEFVMNNLLNTGADKVHTKNRDGDNEAEIMEEFITNYIHQRI